MILWRIAWKITRKLWGSPCPNYPGKITHELRKNLARERDNPEWKFQELREPIVKEIRILEAGAQLNDTPYRVTPSITGSFLTQTQEKQLYSGKSSKPESKKCL